MKSITVVLLFLKLPKSISFKQKKNMRQFEMRKPHIVSSRFENIVEHSLIILQVSPLRKVDLGNFSIYN